jgi:predicted dehydrogenase
VVGCGLISSKRVDALPEGARLVAVFDIDVARAHALAAQRPGADVAESPDAMFARDDVDLVIVATPHRELAPLAVGALDAGRHVLVEKPGAIDVAGARAIAEHAAAAGRAACVGFNHRFHPAMAEAKRIVDGGEFGEIMHIRARYGHGARLGYEREWRADRAVSGGGELIDQGIHLVDLTRFFAGDATLAFSELRTSFWDMHVEDNAFLALRCASGAFAWLHASWTEWKNLFSLEIMLERAKIDIAGLGGSYGTESLTLFEMLPEMGPPIAHREEWEQSDESWALELEACLETIDGAVPRGASIDDAVAALSIVGDAYGGAELS